MYIYKFYINYKSPVHPGPCILKQKAKRYFPGKLDVNFLIVIIRNTEFSYKFNVYFKLIINLSSGKLISQ